MQKLKIGRIVLGSCQTNCYFVYREEEKQAIVFDPADKGAYLYEKLTEKGFQIISADQHLVFLKIIATASYRMPRRGKYFTLG